MPARRATTGKTKSAKPAAERGEADRAANGAGARRRKKLPDGMSMGDMTRARAYELWSEHGTDGREHDDWMRAETEVRARYRES